MALSFNEGAWSYLGGVADVRRSQNFVNFAVWGAATLHGLDSGTVRCWFGAKPASRDSRNADGTRHSRPSTPLPPGPFIRPLPWSWASWRSCVCGAPA